MSIETPTKKRRQTFKIVDGKIAMNLAKHRSVKAVTDAHSSSTKKATDARQANIQAMNLLLQSFPAAFDLHNRKPLKTGIKDELTSWATDHNISKKALSGALRYYTSGNAYLQATLKHSQRIDLQGEAVEEISIEQREYAQMLLNKRNENYQQKQAEKSNK